jgi:hypothetical protein
MYKQALTADGGCHGIAMDRQFTVDAGMTLWKFIAMSPGWLVADVRAGKHVECSWEFFRLQHFPGWPRERLAAALGTVANPAAH